LARLTFLGATGTTTGSKFLFEHDGFRLLVDCGLFQGLKKLRLRNREPLPIDVTDVDAVVLTHAHIDHTGYLPRLVKDGFSGPVYCTKSTAELCAVMLMDSAHLQEEEARWANKKGYSKHEQALPLYDSDDAEAAISLLEPLPYSHRFELGNGLVLWFLNAGHILGSSFVSIEWKAKNDETRKIVFSGDLGRANKPVLRDPVQISEADWLVLESTYGDRLHGEETPQSVLAKVVKESAARGGVLLIPAFSVGRTQELLYHIREMEDADEIMKLPVYVDSPMAIRATRVYMENVQDHDLQAALLEVRGVDIFRTRHLKFTEATKQSIELNSFNGPGIIISASGMLSGGRILHHLVNKMPDPRTTILFIGYQAEGTRGRAILEGAESVKIHGEYVPVKAAIEQISGYSAHADYEEILAWLRGFTSRPQKTFVVHGEPESSAAMAEKLQKVDFHPYVPEYQETVELD
jgi:metallo-beta-lactamase family protein